ncbi:hypothetical protein QJS04_geneDACA003546 [Acorus gramineus]|uniref:VQ domain-containing protein n=1 Tax=Acorus gramineus TaxID=55184 RepID=A0AAV9BL48_ACOGR|nr:hypothetical protein QJS04_geneDACA003546 [Acorus gramineus]
MASFDNCSTLDSWTFRPSFATETETLTKALQKTLSREPSFDSLLAPAGSAPSSDNRRRQAFTIPPSPSSRVSKRKSRVSKRSPTTFITADPSNFRQMVQQVTGVRIGAPVESVMKAEPQRVQQGGCLLPTLDTSAIPFSDGAMGGHVASGSGSDASGFDFELFASFPTLESWGVM